MRIPSITPALLVLTLAVGFPASTHAQTRVQPAPAPEGSGIWLGDSSGALRRVEPAPQSFLREAPRTRVVFVVESFAESATGALSAARLGATRVASAVSGTSAGSAGIDSEVAWVEPRYQHRILAARWEKPRRLGFDAAYYVSVPAADPGRLGLLIDLAMGAGATRVVEVETGGGQ